MVIRIENKLLKNTCRIVGGINAGIGGWFGYFYLNIHNTSLEMVRAWPLADTLEKQLLISTYITFETICTGVGILVSSFLIADGISDIIKGNHHYLGQRIIEKIPKLNYLVNRDEKGV